MRYSAFNRLRRNGRYITNQFRAYIIDAKDEASAKRKAAAHNRAWNKRKGSTTTTHTIKIVKWKGRK